MPRRSQRSIYPPEDHWLALRMQALEHGTAATKIVEELIARHLASPPDEQHRTVEQAALLPDD